MPGFFSRAKKAVVAAVGAFISAVLLAMHTGTVFRTAGGFGINWAAIVSAAGLALAAGIAVFMARNEPETARQRGRAAPGDGSVL